MLTLLITFAITAPDGFRCPSGRLVSLGQNQAEVLARCKAPNMVSEHLEIKRTATAVTQQGRTARVIPPAIVRYLQSIGVAVPAASVTTVPTTVTKVAENEVQIVVADWIYDFGSSRFIRALRFENGVLVKIDEGDYGAASQPTP